MTSPVAQPGEGSPSDSVPAGGARGGLGKAVAAGLRGEAVSGRGVLELIGGVRGMIESTLPALVYLVVFVFTGDARVSVIAPALIALVAVIARVVRRESLAASLSGVAGVAICVVATLISGRGEDFFLPGFWINGAWILAHTVSLLVRWPLIGVLLGAFMGSLTEWRSKPVLRRAAQLLTLVWIAVFAARLAVQVPLYLSASAGDVGAVEALGMARLVMGVPLFALAAIFTWLVLSRAAQASVSSDEQHAEVPNTQP